MGPSSTDEFVFRHRICHCEGDDESPLITPCHCTGSLHFVHQACLQQWIKSSDTRCCELCKYEFIMETKLKPLRKVRKKGHSGRVILSDYPGPPVVTALKIGGRSLCCRSSFLVVISQVRPSFIMCLFFRTETIRLSLFSPLTTSCLVTICSVLTFLCINCVFCVSS